MTSFSPLSLFSSLTDGDKLLPCPSGRLPLLPPPSLSLLLSTCWCHCCSASIVVFYFFTQLILHTPLLFFTLFITSHPFTQSIYKQTEERRRLRTTQETDTHQHTFKIKHFKECKEVGTYFCTQDQDFWDTLWTTSVLDHNCWQEWCRCLCGVRRKRARTGLSLQSEPHGTPAPLGWGLFRDFCSQRRDTCRLLSTSLSSRENHCAERNWPSGPWRYSSYMLNTKIQF